MMYLGKPRANFIITLLYFRCGIDSSASG